MYRYIMEESDPNLYCSNHCNQRNIRVTNAYFGPFMRIGAGLWKKRDKHDLTLMTLSLDPNPNSLWLGPRNEAHLG